MTQKNDNMRQWWLSTLACANCELLYELLSDVELPNTARVIRAPELGTVMVQGRVGGDGAGFHFGEMTITRCSVALDDQITGHGYIQGRDKKASHTIALLDALLQTERQQEILQKVIYPLIEHQKNFEKGVQEKAAATKVEFFTMARGED